MHTHFVVPSSSEPHSAWWAKWMWLAIAGAITVVLVFGCLHAGRSFWSLASSNGPTLTRDV